MATKYIVNNLTGQTINGQQLQPYKVYTALLTQNGTSTESSISAGTLTIGVTYFINQDSTGMDFTNVGAPNNNVGTAFVATGTTPNSWGSGADYTLAYDEGAPVVTVLENTIGNIWFTYGGAGVYEAESIALFTENKTFALFGGAYSDTNTQSGISCDNSSLTDSLLPFSVFFDGSLTNSHLLKTPIEIRVYN
jgi:hypothetical protein